MTFPGQLLLGAPVGTTAGWVLGQLAVNYASDADFTLTTSGASPQSTNNALQVTSGVSLTATRKLIVPLSFGQQYTVQNNTTGGRVIEIIGPSGTGILVPPNTTISVVCDGTNYVLASSGSSFWLSVSNWYIDPANISGTASDTNDGLSAATALLTVAEMIQRYGTSSPFLTQGVTWNQLSSQTAGTDVFVFNPQSDGTGMTWIGTPQNVGGTFSPTSLTARTRGNPGSRLTFNFGTLPAGVAVGQYIKNVTRNSYAIVTSVGATSFTVSQPIHILLVDTSWTSGNTYQLFTPVGLNWINPQTSGGSLEVENVEFLDNAAVWTAAPTGIQPFFYNCQFDSPYTTLDGSKCMSIFLAASPTIYFAGIELANCQFSVNNQYVFLRETYMFGGSANATGLNNSSISFLDAVADGDCQLWNAIFKGSSYIGAMECDGTLLIVGGVTQMPGLNGLNFLWGGCTVNVTYGGEFSTPFYNDVTVAALQLDGVTTGSSFNAAAVGNPYTAGITITSANISTGGGAGNPGLQNPRTGSRYAST